MPLVTEGYLYNRDCVVGEIRNDAVVLTNLSKAPLFFKINSSLVDWLETRVIDGTRSHSRLLKRMKGLVGKSDAEVALSVHGATVTDGYWVRSKDEDITYRQVCFTYDSLFDVAAYGNTSVTDTQASVNTPQLSLNGSLEKGWKLENGHWWIYKTEGNRAAFNECFCESVSRLMSVKSALYYQTEAGVKSLNFAEQHDFEDLTGLVGDNWTDYSLTYNLICKAFGEDAGAQYLELIYFDAVVCNGDRHSGNFGVLRDRDTGAFMSLAPNYDYDQTLFGDVDNAPVIKKDVIEDTLIRDFLDCVEGLGICFQPTVITREQLEKETETLSGFQLYPAAIDFVLNRQELLLGKLKDVCDRIGDGRRF